MYGLNAVALIFFCCINVLAYQLSKRPVARSQQVIQGLSAVLLLGNLFRYLIFYPFIRRTIQIPVEFSTVAYFVVPLILLTRSERLKSWAAYSGLMAGFFYYMAMILAGGPIYHAEAPLDVYISMFCHGTVYACGFVTIASSSLRARDGKKLLCGVALVATRAALLRPWVQHSERLLIYILLDGAAVKTLLPTAAWHFALPIYYFCVAALVLLSIRGFFRSSKAQYWRFAVMRANSSGIPATVL